jgi:hypothetical protein
MPVVGFMTVVWGGALDLGQIWSSLGFFFLSFLLLWLELEAMEKNNVPLNKALVRGHRSLWSRGAEEFLLADHVGVGKKQVGVSICASGRWQGRSMLQLGENHTVARISIVICD